jgi:hypothetical protein
MFEYLLVPEAPSYLLSQDPSTAGLGISPIAFDRTGKRLATVVQAFPNAVWVWFIGGQTIQLLALLVHEKDVKQILWSPLITELLMIIVDSDIPIVRQLMLEREPRSVPIPLKNRGGKYEARWLKTRMDDRPDIFLFGSPTEYLVGHIVEDKEGAKFKGIETPTTHEHFTDILACSQGAPTLY